MQPTTETDMSFVVGLLFVSLFSRSICDSQAGFVYETLSGVAPQTGAVCLDGSTPGYFVRDDGKTSKWIVYLQWGGWCVSLDDCLNRANTTLGSSKNWNTTTNLANVSILSGNRTENPYFAAWNAAYLPYCDGSSFSSDLSQAVNVNGTNLYFRGARILKATFDALFQRHSLGATSELVVTGCSAGSLASYLHADRIQSWFAPTVKFGVIPDSGDASALLGTSNTEHLPILRVFHELFDVQ
jgi:hypothetical protein